MATVRASFARGRFYYGWVIVALGFITEFTLVSMRSYGSGVFIKPMSLELGWSRAVISSVISAGWLVEGLISPFVGPILDKRGARGLIVVGAVISGVGYAALGLVQGLWEFYLFRGVVTTVGFACAGHMVINVAINNWFVRQRGKAVAISLMGVSLGGAVMTPFAVYLIASLGWRLAWVVLGVAILVVVIPPAALFMKRRPEDVGLLPDGDRVESRESRVEKPVSTLAPAYAGARRSNLPREETWTRGEAMRTSTLWLTLLAFGPATMGASTVGVHFFPYLTDIGLSDAVAGAVFSTYATSTAIFRPVWGVLIDKYQVKRCAVAALVFLAGEVVMFSLLSQWQFFWLVYLAAIFAGFATAGQGPVTEVFWASYYGRLSLGTVRSIIAPFSIVFGGGGPLLAGWIFDRSGSYLFAWVLLAFTYSAGAALLLLSRPPKKRARVIVTGSEA